MITDKDPTYLLDQLRQAVLLIDSKGRLTYCNEAASLLWHRDASRLQGMEVDLLFQIEHIGVIRAAAIVPRRPFEALINCGGVAVDHPVGESLYLPRHHLLREDPLTSQKRKAETQD